MNPAPFPDFDNGAGSLSFAQAGGGRLRIQQALAHQKPGRLPFSWGLRPTAEMTAVMDHFLRQRGMSWHGLVLATEDSLAISPRYIGPPLPPDTDIWGIVRKNVQYGSDDHNAGSYDEIAVYPLAGAATPAEVEAYPWPDPAWFDYASLRRQVLAADPAGNLAGKLWIDVCGNPFEIYTWMTGHEQTFTNLRLRPEVVHAAMNRITQFFEQKLRRALPMVADRVDVCYFADDLGGQRRLLMSPGDYRQLIMPYHQRLFKLAKVLAAEAGAPPPAIMFHSDGAIFDILPELLEAGVQVLEAVQVDAAGMDPLRLKQTYGDRLTFHGAISVQNLLPNSAEIAVEVECRRLGQVFGASGGYIAAPSHSIQVGTPPENVLAMLRGVFSLEDTGLETYAAALQAARLEPFSLAFNVHRGCLYLPVKNGAERIVFELEREGQVIYQFDIELALCEAPDWWACLEIGAFQGEAFVLRTVGIGLPRGAFGWLTMSIHQGDELPWAEDLYHERLRPQLHFTPRHGWNNDPNGMVYLEGAWHLFFQYNPYGVTWGNMHWGHAVSRDLVYWQELPIALFPPSLSDMAFSGGALVLPADILPRPNHDLPPLPPGEGLLISFTSTGRGECLAYSLDGAHTFHEFPNNPVLTHAGRDPKIIIPPPARQSAHAQLSQDESLYTMIVYEEPDADTRGYALYTSRHLTSWQRTDFLPGYFECPELFQLTVEGSPGERYWVIHGALWQGDRSVFQLGQFDCERFIPLGDPLPAHRGPHFYAAQVFSNAPGGRIILIGWLIGAAYPGMPFSQGMTLPLELSLRRTSQGIRLYFNPVPELNELRTRKHAWERLSAPHANHVLSALPGDLLDITLVFGVHDEHPFSLDIGDQQLLYDPQSQQVSFAGSAGQLSGEPATLKLRLLLDRSVVEVFVQDGELAFAAKTLFHPGCPRLEVHSQGTVKSLEVFPLKSIWPPPEKS